MLLAIVYNRHEDWSYEYFKERANQRPRKNDTKSWKQIQILGLYDPVISRHVFRSCFY